MISDFNCGMISSEFQPAVHDFSQHVQDPSMYQTLSWWWTWKQCSLRSSYKESFLKISIFTTHTKCIHLSASYYIYSGHHYHWQYSLKNNVQYLGILDDDIMIRIIEMGRNYIIGLAYLKYMYILTLGCDPLTQSWLCSIPYTYFDPSCMHTGWTY